MLAIRAAMAPCACTRSYEPKAIGSRGRVERLMRRHGISALARRRFRPTTTDSRHAMPTAPNLLLQEFTVSASNQVWLADIAYSAPRPGWSGVDMSGMQ
ncbi:hypothetical protein MAE02_62960 [Microvirga aerophila]|uniref:HTH-like domain-containing protein n=1 Tax=Microvirga aerophila TaxID=670291 RepID=A0A512C309_9HYPH|nr:hypothetical protein MAE02_62960 [Microvirga aerophila]